MSGNDLLHYDHIIVKQYSSLDSTQIEAARLLQSGELRHGMIVSADEQTHGKGRYGRSWYSEPDNIAMTICTALPHDIDFPQVCYVAAISVGDAINQLSPTLTVKYKWINDIMIDDAKLGGILIESVATRFLLIGVGVNVGNAPEIHGRATTNLKMHIPLVDIAALRQLIIQCFVRNYNDWLQYGFAGIRRKYKEHAYKLGEQITVQIPLADRQYQGVFRDIDPDGNMELEGAISIQTLSLGEVL